MYAHHASCLLIITAVWVQWLPEQYLPFMPSCGSPAICKERERKIWIGYSKVVMLPYTAWSSFPFSKHQHLNICYSNFYNYPKHGCVPQMRHYYSDYNLQQNVFKYQGTEDFHKNGMIPAVKKKILRYFVPSVIYYYMASGIWENFVVSVQLEISLALGIHSYSKSALYESRQGHNQDIKLRGK